MISMAAPPPHARTLHDTKCARVNALVRVQMMLHCSSPEGIFLSTDPRADRWKGYLSSVILTLCQASVAILAIPGAGSQNHLRQKSFGICEMHYSRLVRILLAAAASAFVLLHLVQ